MIHTPIRFEYERPSPEFLESLRSGNGCVSISNQPGIQLEPIYFRKGIKGSLESTYIRTRVYEALQVAAKSLPEGFGFIIFDAYRSKETQAGLFEAYSKQIQAQYPAWTDEQLYSETRKFVAHPDEPSRFEVPPHNSGGAIDLGLTYEGTAVDMGTDFDDLTDRAATDFFESSFKPNSDFTEERWMQVRTNRRILFHSMRGAGFTNWKHEWWHFDMGNCVWAQEHKIPWIYGSMTP